ncbi:DUF4625 domain-containing protein [Pseudozobellia sp. WGM2]|uniref:DUF4625 domain-containing protein n=1 Tax=Pseudozobellia sp. WGM2 TaxID=2787625 RepID=UPI001AE09EB1|nr:DUF4625 domain-containing protein [Pseudozobellia sp. WGM2]
MKKIKKFLCFIMLLFINSCSTDDSASKDVEKPTISIAYSGGFPKGCDQLKRGETYVFRAMVTDNEALASYSLNLHHNFDHHTHDDQVGDCDLNESKSAVNPWIFMQNFSIEESSLEHEIEIELAIPDDIDTGDYHCAYSVTDASGWQGRTSIDIKIVQ